jgi:hypothetical protein
MSISDRDRQLRMNIRNFLLIATLAELEREECISRERNDPFRAQCVRELIAEYKAAFPGPNGEELEVEY